MQLTPLLHWVMSDVALSSPLDTDATACCSKEAASAETAALATNVAAAAQIDADSGGEGQAAKKVASACGACLTLLSTLALLFDISLPAMKASCTSASALAAASPSALLWHLLFFFLFWCCRVESGPCPKKRSKFST